MSASFDRLRTSGKVVIARRLRRGNLVPVLEPSPHRFSFSNGIAALRSQ